MVPRSGSPWFVAMVMLLVICWLSDAMAEVRSNCGCTVTGVCDCKPVCNCSVSASLFDATPEYAKVDSFYFVALMEESNQEFVKQEQFNSQPVIQPKPNPGPAPPNVHHPDQAPKPVPVVVPQGAVACATCAAGYRYPAVHEFVYSADGQFFFHPAERIWRRVTHPFGGNGIPIVRCFRGNGIPIIRRLRGRGGRGGGC